MLDPMQGRLAQVHHAEQLTVAADARRRRATWTAGPRLAVRLRTALSSRGRTVRSMAAVAQALGWRLPVTERKH
jgi:hypothetical protein